MMYGLQSRQEVRAEQCPTPTNGFPYFHPLWLVLSKKLPISITFIISFFLVKQSLKCYGNCMWHCFIFFPRSSEDKSFDVNNGFFSLAHGTRSSWNDCGLIWMEISFTKSLSQLEILWNTYTKKEIIFLQGILMMIPCPHLSISLCLSFWCPLSFHL